jgi:hypothetical protein
MRLDVTYDLCSKLGSKLLFIIIIFIILDRILAILVVPDHFSILTVFSES